MSGMRGEEVTPGQIDAFRRGAALGVNFDPARIKAGLAAVGHVRTPLTDLGVLVVLQILDAAMDALHESDRGRVARAFMNRHGNEISQPDAPALTMREWKVLRALAGGSGTEGAARIANMGVKTVSTHISHIMTKLDANDRTHMVAEAFRRGML